MSTFEKVGPSRPVTESTRVDKVNLRAKILNALRVIVVVVIALIMLIPVFVMGIRRGPEGSNLTMDYRRSWGCGIE